MRKVVTEVEAYRVEGEKLHLEEQRALVVPLTEEQVMAGVQTQQEEHLGEHLVGGDLVHPEEEVRREVSLMEKVMLQGEHLVEEAVGKEQQMEEGEVHLVLAEVNPTG